MNLLFDIYHIEDKLNLKISKEGEKCDFLRFLINTTTMYNEKPDFSVKSLLAKCCAIGYLLLPYKDINAAKAVITIGGECCGKSLFSEALAYATDLLFIDMKQIRTHLVHPSISNDITEKTRIVLLDNLYEDFNFEELFVNISGDWIVEEKRNRKYIVPFDCSPKLLITTNNNFKIHENPSYRNRQWIIQFSDYYNKNYKPLDTFKKLFFDGWDSEQWYLFYRCLSTCVLLYLQYGVIEDDKKYGCNNSRCSDFGKCSASINHL